jgi:hypothetical protein
MTEANYAEWAFQLHAADVVGPVHRCRRHDFPLQLR